MKKSEESAGGELHEGTLCRDGTWPSMQGLAVVESHSHPWC